MADISNSTVRIQVENKELSYDELLAKAKNPETPLTAEEIQALKFHKDTLEQVESKKVLSGVNNVFRKHYKLAERDLDFHISIKAPSVLDLAEINVAREQMCGGIGKLLPESQFVLFQTMATFKICGEDIPLFLQDPSKIYASDIVVMIGRDYADWLDTFQY